MRVYMAGYLSFLHGNDLDAHAITASAPVESVLESFFYFDEKKLELRRQNPQWHFLLDSGAYSAFSRGARIDVDEYLAFCRKTDGLWDLIAGLDVIGDADASWANFVHMRKHGVLTMPTFHYGEPWEFLDSMVAEAPYIAIGGVAQLGSGSALVEWLDAVWSNHLCNPEGTAKVKVHGFAVTGAKAMLRYPWESVDSTAWLQMAGHGTVILDLPDQRGGWRDIKVAFSDRSPHMEAHDKHYDSLRPAWQSVIRERLETLGYEIENLRQSYRWRQHANISYFRRCESRAATRFVRTQAGLFF